MEVQSVYPAPGLSHNLLDLAEQLHLLPVFDGAVQSAVLTKGSKTRVGPCTIQVAIDEAPTHSERGQVSGEGDKVAGHLGGSVPDGAEHSSNRMDTRGLVPVDAHGANQRPAGTLAVDAPESATFQAHPGPCVHYVDLDHRQPSAISRRTERYRDVVMRCPM